MTAQFGRVDEQTIEADARITLDDLAEALARAPLVNAGRYTSLGGYLLFEFGPVPDAGDTMEREGLTFTIRSVQPTRAERVLKHDQAALVNDIENA